MGRAKNKRRTGRESDTEDDTLSSTSTETSTDFWGQPDVEEEHDEASVLDSYIEALYEKRSSTREAGLQGLSNALANHVLVEVVEDKFETISHMCLTCAKKGSALERALASRSLGLMAITAGAGEISRQILLEAGPHLVKVARTDTASAARVAALENFGVLAFVGAADLEATENAMKSVWPICAHKGNQKADQASGISRPPGSVRAAALTAWALLFSTLPASRAANNHLESSLATLQTLVKGDDAAVRSVAGSTVSLLYEITGHLVFNKGAEAQENTSDLNMVKLFDEAGKVSELKESQVVEQIKSLSINAGSKGQLKRDRHAQRAIFRELLPSIEDGKCRELIVKLPAGDNLRVSHWVETIQLNALRRVLGQGFQRHMQDNNLLHEIFDFTPRTGKRPTMSANRKRMFMSPNSVVSKARTQLRNKDRSIAQAGNAGQFSVHFEE